MIKKLILIILTIAVLMASASCSYFLPAETKVVTPELRDSEDVIMPSTKIRMGDIKLFYDLPATFLPDPPELYTAELKRNGKVSEIYYSIGESVREGDLVLKLDTESIENSIMVQEIKVEKNRLNHETNLALYESGKVDSYTVEFSRLTLEASRNYLSDLREDMEEHYVYSPSDGVIVSMFFSIGDNAFGPVFTVSDPAKGIAEVVLVTDVDNRPQGEAEMLKLKIGDEVLILYNGVEYNATLIRDASTYATNIDYDPELRHVNFRLDEIPEGISFNKGFTVRNVISEAYDVVVIPMNSVYSAETNPYTHVLINGEIVKREIELGMNDGHFYEVISGLQEGEMIFKIN